MNKIANYPKPIKYNLEKIWKDITEVKQTCFLQK